MTQESCRKTRQQPPHARRIIVELDTDEKDSPIREREESSEDDEEEDVDERCDTQQKWNQCGEDRITNTSVLDDI